MGWRLHTTDYRADGIFSELYNDDVKFCITLERAYEQPDKSWAPKLPRGVTYQCKLGPHRLVQYNKGQPFQTYEIMGVPGHSGILFHPGSLNSNSTGCVMPARNIEKAGPYWWGFMSKLTFDKLIVTLGGVQTFSLEVE